jgi:citrate lyase subunit beta/citryl-CoA lyase
MSQDRTAFLTTWLYVPADQRTKLDKALSSGADAIIADLEDGVAASSKAAARESLRDWLGSLADHAEPRPVVWVRVNAGSVAEDLAVGVHPAVAGVCLPKAEAVPEVQTFVAAVAAAEARQRVGGEPTAVMLMIETARGLLAAADLASASDRITVLQLGEQDLNADLGLPPGFEAGVIPSPLRAARDAVVVASAAGRLLSPIGPVSTFIHDADALRQESNELRRNGFGGRATIHPAQLEPVAAGFAPSTEERAWAERVVAANDEAAAGGSGVTLVDGRMVDAPVVAQAQRLLRRAAD